MNETNQFTKKLLTIVTETAIENSILRDLDDLKVSGYTITNARGKGSRGIRNASWETSGNVRIEIVCDDEMSKRISTFIREKYYKNYAMIIYVSDVEVLRPDKF